jgi:hypothetical protein
MDEDRLLLCDTHRRNFCRRYGRFAQRDADQSCVEFTPETIDKAAQ